MSLPDGEAFRAWYHFKMERKRENKPADSRPKKKPYQPPAILYREPLEAMAAVCAPAPPSKSNPGLCPSGPISS